MNLKTPSLPRRMACWLYEGVLLFGVVFIASYLFSTLSQTRNALDNRHAQQAFIFVVLGIYFVWLWTKGQTLAMKTWHIRVVDKQGKNLRQSRALLRYLVSWLWFLPALALSYALGLGGATTVVLMLAWAIIWAFASKLNSRQQFLHDLLAGTQLIHHEPTAKT